MFLITHWEICLFVFFASFIIVPLTSVINKSSNWTIFVASFISSFENISAVIPGPDILLWISTYVADAATNNPNGKKHHF